MAATLFIPFTDAEDPNDLEEMAFTWTRRVSLDPRGKPPPLPILYDPAQRELEDRDPAESIYVLAHGGGNPNYIFNNRGGLEVQTAGISAAILAQRLARSGLSPQQQRLKLYICNVAGSMRPFAERMKALLASRCLNLTVSYYTGSVSLPVQKGEQVYHKFTTVDVSPGPQGFIIEHVGAGLRSRASAGRIDL